MVKKKTLGKRKQLQRLREQLRILNDEKKKKPNISFIELENVTNKTAATVLADEHGHEAGLAAAAAGHLEQGKRDSPLSIDGTDNKDKKIPTQQIQNDDVDEVNDDDELEDLVYENQRFPDEENTSINEESDERRIVDFKYFLKQLKTISSHSTAFGCGINNLELIGEKSLGLISKLKFKCNMCNVELTTNTSKSSSSDNLKVNTAVATSAAITGVGYIQLQEIFTSINGRGFYKKIDNRVSEEWEKLAATEMEAAAAREKQSAMEESRIHSVGIPVIDVIVDGCWAKRTYKKNYSSLSGAAAIVGKKFGEAQYLVVKNKYCCICVRAQNKQTTPTEHMCFKNYTGSSTNMESEILVEGFKQSLHMYGLIYGKMVADGDASTYSKILEAISKLYNPETFTLLKLCKTLFK